MLPQLSRYTIIARRGPNERTATRLNANSAMVLADRWAREGCEDVTIIDRDGTPHTRSAFRQTLPAARKRARLAV